MHLVVTVVVLPESGEVVAPAYGVEAVEGAVVQSAGCGLYGELAVYLVGLAYLLELENPDAHLGSKPGCAAVFDAVQKLQWYSVEVSHFLDVDVFSRLLLLEAKFVNWVDGQHVSMLVRHDNVDVLIVALIGGKTELIGDAEVFEH